MNVIAARLFFMVQDWLVWLRKVEMSRRRQSSASQNFRLNILYLPFGSRRAYHLFPIRLKALALGDFEQRLRLGGVLF